MGPDLSGALCGIAFERYLQVETDVEKERQGCYIHLLGGAAVSLSHELLIFGAFVEVVVDVRLSVEGVFTLHADEVSDAGVVLTTCLHFSITQDSAPVPLSRHSLNLGLDLGLQVSDARLRLR